MTNIILHNILYKGIQYNIHPETLGAQIYQIEIQSSNDNPQDTIKSNQKKLNSELQKVFSRSKSLKYLTSNTSYRPKKTYLGVVIDSIVEETDTRNLWSNPLFIKAMAGTKEVPVISLHHPNLTRGKEFLVTNSYVESYVEYQREKSTWQPGWNQEKVMARNWSYRRSVSRLEEISNASFPLDKYIYILVSGLYYIIFRICNDTNNILILETFLGLDPKEVIVPIDSMDPNDIPSFDLFLKINPEVLLNRLPKSLINKLVEKYFNYHKMEYECIGSDNIPFSKGNFPSDFEYEALNVKVNLSKFERKFLQQSNSFLTPLWVLAILKDSLSYHANEAYLLPDTYSICEGFVYNTCSMYSRFESFEINHMHNHQMVCSYEVFFIKEISVRVWNSAIVRDLRLRNVFHYQFLNGEIEVFRGASHPEIYNYRPNFNLSDSEINEFHFWKSLHVRYAETDINGYIYVSEDNIFGIPIGTILGKWCKAFVSSNPIRYWLDSGRSRDSSFHTALEIHPFLTWGEVDLNKYTYNTGYRPMIPYRYGSREYFEIFTKNLMSSLKKKVNK